VILEYLRIADVAPRRVHGAMARLIIAPHLAAEVKKAAWSRAAIWVAMALAG
jgi:hypothetical protein